MPEVKQEGTKAETPEVDLTATPSFFGFGGNPDNDNQGLQVEEETQVEQPEGDTNANEEESQKTEAPKGSVSNPLNKFLEKALAGTPFNDVDGLKNSYKNIQSHASRLEQENKKLREQLSSGTLDHDGEDEKLQEQYEKNPIATLKYLINKQAQNSKDEIANVLKSHLTGAAESNELAEFFPDLKNPQSELRNNATKAFDIWGLHNADPALKAVVIQGLQSAMYGNSDQKAIMEHGAREKARMDSERKKSFSESASPPKNGAKLQATPEEKFFYNKYVAGTGSKLTLDQYVASHRGKH